MTQPLPDTALLDEIERQNAEFAYQPGHVMATLLRLARAGLRVPALEDEVARLTNAKTIVNMQACDDGLWFLAETATEAYLQEQLRALHAAIEGKTPEQCALAALNPKDPAHG